MFIKKNYSLTVTLAVMSIFLLSMGASTITPALASIFSAFTYKDYSVNTLLLVSTLPYLLVIPSSLIAGMLAGSKIKYKMLAVIGIFIFVE